MTMVHPYKPGKHTLSFAGPSRYCALVVGMLFTSLDSISSMMACLLHIFFMKWNMFLFQSERYLSDSARSSRPRDAPGEDSCVGTSYGVWLGDIFAASVVPKIDQKVVLVTIQVFVVFCAP